MTLKERAHALNQDIPAIFLALKSPDTPLIAKFFGALTVAYALSPIDLIPDFIPVLGMLDDLLLLPLLASLTLRFIPPDVLTRCRQESAGLWASGKPKRWYYALPIALFWLLILWCIGKQFLF